jgi:hypothetical protein
VREGGQKVLSRPSADSSKGKKCIHFLEQLRISAYSAAAAANVCLDGDVLVVQSGSEEHKFPAIWLRDNCQCPKCFHKDSQARLVLMRDLDHSMKPSRVELLGEEQAVL